MFFYAIAQPVGSRKAERRLREAELVAVVAALHAVLPRRPWAAVAVLREAVVVTTAIAVAVAPAAVESRRAGATIAGPLVRGAAVEVMHAVQP